MDKSVLGSPLSATCPDDSSYELQCDMQTTWDYFYDQSMNQCHKQSGLLLHYQGQDPSVGLIPQKNDCLYPKRCEPVPNRFTFCHQTWHAGAGALLVL